MIQIALETLWFFLPGILGNGLIPTIVKLPFVKKEKFHSIDLGATLRGRRVFGANKTIEGYLIAIGIAFLAGLLQHFLADVPFFQKYSLIDYSGLNILWIAPVQGFAAVFGDSVKSFIKRQFDIAPGKPFYFFDQTDIVFTSVLFSALLYPVSWPHYVGLLILYPLMHFVFTIIGYLLGIRESWI